MGTSVEIIVADLHIPAAQSLKDKRRVIKSTVERVHQRLRASVAETDHHDLRQRSEVTMAVVLTSSSSRSEELRRLVELDPALTITGWHAEIIDIR